MKVVIQCFIVSAVGSVSRPCTPNGNFDFRRPLTQPERFGVELLVTEAAGNFTVFWWAVFCWSLSIHVNFSYNYNVRYHI